MFRKKEKLFNKCDAIGCSQHAMQGISFFRFPKDPERCRVWLQRCRRKDLWVKFERSSISLHGVHRLCADHFDDSQFMNVDLKNNLIPKAVPSKFDFSSCSAKDLKRLLPDDFEFNEMKLNPNNDLDGEDSFAGDKRFIKPEFSTEESEEINDQLEGDVQDSYDELTEIFSLNNPTNSQEKNTEEKKTNIVIKRGAVDAVRKPGAIDMQSRFWFDISAKLASYRKKEFLCDVILSAKTKEFKTHSILLSAVSQVFHSVFESGPSPKVRHIKMPDVDDEILEIFLNFVYTGQLKLPSRCANFDVLSSVLTSLKCLGIDINKLNGCKMEFDKSPTCLMDRRENLTKSSNDSIDASIFQMVSTGEVLSGGHEEGLKNRSTNGSEEASEELKLDHVSHFVYNVKCEKRDLEEPDCGEHIQVSSECNQGDEGVAFVCYICGASISGSRNDLSLHMSEHNNEKLYVCDKCGKRFTHKNYLLVHIAKHEMGFYVSKKFAKITEEEKTVLFTCELCSKPFRKRKNLCNHMESMHTGKCHVCETCGSEFSMLCNLRRHKKLVHCLPSKPFICQECGNSFSKRQNLEAHMMGAHSLGNNGAACPLCGKSFKPFSVRSYRMHLDEHSDLPPEVKHLQDRYSCDRCGKSFASKAFYNRHVASHADVNSFTCHVCGKTFGLQACLNQHLHWHKNKTKEKTFECADCGKKFLFRSMLAQHQLVHGANKPYSCTVCGKGFLNKMYEQIHMRIHTGERPYSCLLCTSSFKQEHHLKRHILCHTGEKPFACDMCPSAYKNKLDLCYHYKKMHGMEVRAVDIKTKSKSRPIAPTVVVYRE